MNDKYLLKQKQIEFTVKAPEYKEALKELSSAIKRGCKKAVNESSVVSVFEIELFSFINTVLNLKYYPEKERLIDTERHISKGRIDSKVGAFIIEFKHKSKLKTSKQIETATEQLINYLKSLDKEASGNYLGLLTDGLNCKFVVSEKSDIYEEAFSELKPGHLDRIIKSIVLLDKVALTPENLVRDFCEPENESIVSELLQALFEAIETKATDKTRMLFSEWMELFRLAHDDQSKQKAIC